MKKFFESIKIELHEHDVLPEAVVRRAFHYFLKDKVFPRYTGRIVSSLVYGDRPTLDFIPRANGS
jgi:hypothetical protein